MSEKFILIFDLYQQFGCTLSVKGYVIIMLLRSITIKNEELLGRGGVDTQKMLTFGSIEQVRDNVKTHCEIFGNGRSFAFNGVHTI